MKYRKINTPLQYSFCSMDFFLQLDNVLLFVYNTTCLLSAPNFNQSTFGIALDGITWNTEEKYDSIIN